MIITENIYKHIILPQISLYDPLMQMRVRCGEITTTHTLTMVLAHTSLCFSLVWQHYAALGVMWGWSEPQSRTAKETHSDAFISHYPETCYPCSPHLSPTIVREAERKLWVLESELRVNVYAEESTAVILNLIDTRLDVSISGAVVSRGRVLHGVLSQTKFAFSISRVSFSWLVTSFTDQFVVIADILVIIEIIDFKIIIVLNLLYSNYRLVGNCVVYRIRQR